MRLIFVVVAVASLLTENLALPVGKEGQREDVVTRCLVEVLSKALSKPDSQLDQECKDILQAGVKHAPLDKKSIEGVATHGEVANGHLEVPEAKGADVKDIEALLKSIEDKREIPEDERSQESWSLGDEKEKRHENGEEEEREKRSWRTGRYHQKKHKRGEEEEDYERSQESWGGEEKRSEEGGGEEKDKRTWRPSRYRQRKHKRDEESLGDEREEPEEERSQEYWDVGKREVDEDEEERHKRIWKPTHRYHHKKKFHKRGDEPSEEQEDGERSQESWGLDKRDWKAGRYHQKRPKRDEELSEETREEPDEERSQESWGLDKRDWRAGRRHKRDEELSEEAREEPDEERSQESWGLDKRDWRAGRYHQRRHKRDEELSEEAREEPDEERSQEYWDFNTGWEKRDRRAVRPHQRRHKRDEELTEEEREALDGQRSQEDWGVDKRHGKEEAGIEKRIWKPTHRYHHKKKFHKRGGDDEELRDDSEEDEDKDEAVRYLAEKRNPWIYRGFYHPAWYKRDSDEHATTSNKMDEVAKLLSYKVNQLAHHSNQEEPNRSMHQRALTQQEEKELGNLAAMDTELQKIVAKLHDNGA
ncbi:secretogranin-1 [Anarrhichthys ocellatus]|uniref:secretogranin-1 n=1 Tax=Anarrhichthys ocellatus TaxID=433405 RepID=UPI0012EEA0AB|nr:trichohyalin-like [Anarrhichthys ocellatus]